MLGGRTPVSRLRHTASEGLCVPRRAAIIAAMTASDAFCVHRRTTILAAGYLRLHMLLCVRSSLQSRFFALHYVCMFMRELVFMFFSAVSCLSSRYTLQGAFFFILAPNKYWRLMWT